MTSIATLVLATSAFVAPLGRVEFAPTIDGVKRMAYVHVPTQTSPKGAPLVFVFHGHGGNGRYSERKFRVHELWPEAMVFYPTGLPTSGMTDPEGKKNGWQNVKGTYDDRDLKFFDAMLVEAKRLGKIDERRIFSMGHSNGARFTYLLWSERGNLFAATAPMAAHGLGLIPTLKPISTFILAGEKDPIVGFRSQNLSMNLLHERYPHSGTPKTKTSGFAKYETMDNGSTFATYVHPGGHEVPEEAVKLAVDFFKGISK